MIPFVDYARAETFKRGGLRIEGMQVHGYHDHWKQVLWSPPAHGHPKQQLERYAAHRGSRHGGQGHGAGLRPRRVTAQAANIRFSLYQRIATLNAPVLINLESDFRGPTKMPASVNSQSERSALPNTAASIGQCLVQTGRQIAPHALLRISAVAVENVPRGGLLICRAQPRSEAHLAGLCNSAPSPPQVRV